MEQQLTYDNSISCPPKPRWRMGDLQAARKPGALRERQIPNPKVKRAARRSAALPTGKIIASEETAFVCR